MITTYGVYRIYTLFFDIINKTGQYIPNRNLYCICNMNNVYWAIPLSTEIQKLKDIIAKRIAERKKAQTTIFTNTFGQPYALLINESIPIHPIFLTNPLLSTIGETLTLPEDEKALLQKWLRRHIIQDRKKIMPFAYHVDRLHQFIQAINKNKDLLKKMLLQNPERMDILDPHNIYHRQVIAVLKESPDRALYASYLSPEQQKINDFFPAKIINGRKSHIKWTDKILNDLNKRRDKQQSISMIAKAYDVSEPIIANLLNKNNNQRSEKNLIQNNLQETIKRVSIPSRQSRFTSEDKKKIREMYWSRISMKKIGEHFNVSGETIRKELKKIGIDGTLRKKISFKDIQYFLNQGLSTQEIAEKTNLSISYLNKVIRLNDLKKDN